MIIMMKMITIERKQLTFDGDQSQGEQMEVSSVEILVDICLLSSDIAHQMPRVFQQSPACVGHIQTMVITSKEDTGEILFQYG